MNLLPKASGTRPRVACEIAPQGVAAARSDAAGAPLAAVASASLQQGAVSPGLKPGNIVDRVEVTAALRKALEAVGARANARSSDITLVIPDGATRVLLLDFEALPNKLSEALPLVRFRLKKLLPFDSDDAMVTFQVMSTTKSIVRVLAVAIPRDVLAEYETVAREAGFEPGAVLPSTLAAMASVDALEPTLVVNVTSLGITTAISREGILLLHRTVDLQAQPEGVPVGVPAALLADATGHVSLPLVSHEDTLAEWAAQEPLPEHGRNPYADRAADEEVTQNQDAISQLDLPPGIFLTDTEPHATPAAGDVHHSPYVAPTVLDELSADSHMSVLIAPTSLSSLTENAADDQIAELAAAALHRPVPSSSAELLAHRAATSGQAHEAEPLPPAEFASEVAQAVSVACAYFEDTLATAPRTLYTAGSLDAKQLGRILTDAGLADSDGLTTRDLIPAEMLAADAASSSTPRSWLAGVTGALRG